MFITERGVLLEKSQIASGSTQSGSLWKRQTIILEVERKNYRNEAYRVNLALEAWTFIVNQLEHIKVGDEIDVTYSVESRKWEKDGRSGWITRASIDKIVEMTNTQAPQTNEESLEPQPDDLPFD